MEWLLKLFGLDTGAIAGAAEKLGITWMVKDGLFRILDGSASGFFRFCAIMGFVLAISLVGLQIWRGDSWMGRFKIASRTGFLLALIAACGVFIGMGGATVEALYALARPGVNERAIDRPPPKPKPSPRAPAATWPFNNVIGG